MADPLVERFGGDASRFKLGFKVEEKDRLSTGLQGHHPRPLRPGGLTGVGGRLSMGLVLVIDNYDWFVYNLVQYLGELGAEPARVPPRRGRRSTRCVALDPAAVLVSPGPGRPEDAGVSNDAIDAFGERGVPVLGVCLGHQCIGQLYGGQVVRADQVMHGKTSMISHSGDGVFAGCRALRGHPLPLAGRRPRRRSPTASR